MSVFIIEAESRFKMKYAVEAPTFEEAFKAIRNNEVEEFYQEHDGEYLVDCSIVSDEELVYQVRLSNGGLYSSWTDEKILEVFKKNVD